MEKGISRSNLTERIIDRINALDMSSAAKRAAIEDLLRAERVAEVLEEAGRLARGAASIVATPLAKFASAAARKFRAMTVRRPRPGKAPGRPATSQ